ncbi:MmpS family transport accessory protein [Gordonia sp. (in: high G+C Gram-positive bacteria)]|uniref:MmpS family transport accessory protein n=1 Tax=Gordonia sp. (in: high G+C Gram-positive bacteria) TaxID=84139 RepID=UPI00260A1D45|nr:MmpS family transport accessory protein [Gordonia sp. (in: high G+C Gram-positive bacteria)]
MTGPQPPYPGQPDPNQQGQPGPYPQGQYPPQGQQPYQYPGPPPAPKKRKKWPWILGGVIVLIIIIAAAAGAGGGDKKTDDTNAASAVAPAPGATTAAETTTKKPAKNTVVYEVTGDSGTANNITYFGENANQSQETDAALPWRSKTFDKSKTTLTGVTAQNGGSGEITCKIIVNGKVEVENTSKGAYAVVSCNGKLF